MKIIYVQISPLGDFLTGLPILAALRRHYPGCLIHGWLTLECGLFAQKVGLIDRFVQTDDLGYDLCLNCQIGTPTRPYKAAQTIDCPAILDDDPTPISAQRMRCLAPLGLAAEPCIPSLTVPTVAEPEGFVAVHPCHLGVKAWPMENWSALGHSLSPPEKLLIISGPADFGRGRVLLQRLPGQGHRLLDSQPLHVVAGQLQNCKRFIGGETGITHLAAALGLTGVAMWSARYRHWQPPGKLKFLEHGGNVSDVTINEVLDAWRTL